MGEISPASEASVKRIILVTTTYDRPLRKEYIKRCIDVFACIKDVLWIVVEDGSDIDPEVDNMLRESSVPYFYLYSGPTRDKGQTQKNAALTYIRDRRLEGIVYMADDDNLYERKLFEQIRKTKRVAVLPVGKLGPSSVERPIVKHGKIVKWESAWKERKYPLDWAGISFNASLLQEVKDPILRGYGKVENVDAGTKTFLSTRMEGETDFLDKIIKSQDELEILCDNCTKVYVWHNFPLVRNTLFWRFFYQIRSFLWIVLPGPIFNFFSLLYRRLTKQPFFKIK